MTPDPRFAQVGLLFRAAALFNGLVALAFFFAAPQMAALLHLQPAPGPGVYIRILAACIAWFGWGYWIVASDPVRYRLFAIQGMLGKLTVVALIVAAVLMGEANWAFAGLATSDLVFGLLFALYLARTRA
ncbi:MAG: hypothetical protein JWP35_4364 [Caulobacter sp.]|nr:hypothetical protein [Caulobacter sp.]